MIKFPSKKQLDEQRQEFPLLLQEDYLLKIDELKEEEQENYDKTDMEDVINITLKVISLKDGSPAKDIEGNSAVGRKIFFTARPNNMGFMKDGTPSKTRSLIANITHQDIFEEMELSDWQSLKDEMVNAEIIQYINQKGVKRNKIGRFLPIKVKNTDEKIPIVEDEEYEKKSE
jgi:hypothetical protein